MEEKTEVFMITEQSLQDKIYTIRGQKVMLDVDLAVIYGYETKNFNRQVKNNQQKFEGDDFMFQLSDEEVEELSRCKNFTLNTYSISSNRSNCFKASTYANNLLFCASCNP